MQVLPILLLPILSQLAPLSNSIPILRRPQPEYCNFNKYFILELYTINQTYIDNVLQNFFKLRDFHNRPPTFAPHIIAAATIARNLNLTLLSRLSAPQKIQQQSPSVYFFVYVFDSQGRTAKSLWDRYRHHSNNDSTSIKRQIIHEMPEFIQIKPSDFNFVYCDVPRQKLDSPFTLTAFTEPFHFTVWLYLLASIIATAILVNSELISARVQFHLTPVLSALITPGLVWSCSKIRRKLNYSGLFLLWTVCCLILVNFYSGAVTSFLITPPEGDPMTKIKHLLERNYALIFDGLVRFGLLKGTVQAYMSLLDRERMRNVNENMQVLENLLKSSSVVEEEDEFIEKIAYSGKFSSVVGWPYALYIATKANELITTRKKLVEGDDRSCLVGKELISGGPLFHVFIPPGSSRASAVYRRFVDSGLQDLWVKEFYGNAFSKRVQDRSKVISSTQIGDSQRNLASTMGDVKSLKLEGRVVKIFILWLLCVFASGFYFLIELFCGQVSKILRPKMTRPIQKN